MQGILQGIPTLAINYALKTLMKMLSSGIYPYCAYSVSRYTTCVCGC